MEFIVFWYSGAGLARAVAERVGKRVVVRNCILICVFGVLGLRAESRLLFGVVV